MNSIVRPLMFFGTTNLDLCVTVENLPVAGQSVLGKFTQYAGGKGANQAVAAARLGLHTMFYTRVGDDNAGQFLRRSLNDAGVSLDAVEIAVGEPSGMALVAVDKDGNNLIIIDPGTNQNIALDSLHTVITKLPTNAVVVVEMGLPLYVIEYLFAQKEKHQFTLIFNPAPVQMGLSGEAWKAVDIVTPNANEATALTGIDVSDLKTAAQAAKVLLKLGPRSVVITLGQEGAYYCDANEAFHTPSFQVVARDTTGAGDAFNGGLSAAIAMGLPIRQAIVKASAVAAISVTRPGAQISMPLASEVEDFLNLMSRQEK